MFTYVQATGEDVSPQKEHPALQKMKFINFFPHVLGNFDPL
jgi:hypothetical protein